MRSSRPIISDTSFCRGHLGDRHAVGRVLAVAQHGDAVGDGEDLLELVADEEHGDALVAEPAEQGEQRRGLVLGDRGGRLVEEQDLGFERQRLGDLDDLHLRDRQGAHLGARVDAAVEQVEIAPRLAVDLGVVDRGRSSSAGARAGCSRRPRSAARGCAPGARR